MLGSFRASVIGYVQSSTLNRVFDALGLDHPDDPVSSKPDHSTTIPKARRSLFNSSNMEKKASSHSTD